MHTYICIYVYVVLFTIINIQLKIFSSKTDNDNVLENLNINSISKKLYYKSGIFVFK